MESRNSNDSFVRWQGRTIEELGKAINLLLSLSIATIGFVIAKILDKDFIFKSRGSGSLILVGNIILLLSIILILLVIYCRLTSFRRTTQIARKREKGETSQIEKFRSKVKSLDKCTWTIFTFSIFTFSLGQLLIITGFIIEVSSRF